MTQRPLEHLIDALAADARPVRPLASPPRRAMTLLLGFALVGGLAVLALSDVQQLLTRYTGREAALALELAAMLATGLLAVTGAFSVSIPGRSKRWLVAPVPPFLLWLLLSGVGCYADLVRSGPTGWELGESLHCLSFIIATSVLFAVPLVWRLSRAKPVDPLPVAILAGLGAAALSAFLLQFFHPFSVTFIDLAVHVAAILAVVGVMSLLGRRTLAAA